VTLTLSPRERLRKEISLYGEAGIIPRSVFVTAILVNDLRAAVEAASLEERALIVELAEYAYDSLRSEALGNFEAVQRWVAKFKNEDARALKILKRLEH